jgi:hypothetical protein
MRKQQITSFAKNEQITRAYLFHFFKLVGLLIGNQIVVSCYVPSLAF